MSTKAEDPEVTETPEGEGEEHEDGGGLTLETINEKLDSLASTVARLVRGGGPARAKQDSAADVAGQVRSEVGKIREAEARQKAREDRIGALETQVQKLSEKPPREYRRITTIMWGGDEDG